MVPHLPLLVGQDTHVASRERTAKQDEPFRLVLREIRVRMVVFNRTFQQSACAGQTPPVMANRGQDNSVDSGRLQDVLVFLAIKNVKTVGRIQCNPIDSSPRHIKLDALRVIKAAIFAVRRLSRFAAAEMS